MKDIEQYIKDNALCFDVEPAEGHWERFEAKLKQKQRSQRRTIVRQTMRIAAVGLLLIMSALYITDHFFSHEEIPAMVANPEFKEAQYYYTRQIDNGLQTLKEIKGVMSDEQRVLLLKELSEADTLFQELQADFEAAPNDPRVVEAMLNHYRVKAMVIDNIVRDLEKIKKTKQPQLKEAKM